MYSRVDAKRVLEGQREKARRIQSAFTRGEDAVHERRLEYQLWTAETRELILRLFDDRTVADDFYSVPPQWPTDSAPLQLRYEAVQQYLSQSIARLQEILVRIDAMPEAAEDVPNPPQPSGPFPVLGDEALKSRVADLLSGPGPFDRAVREAGVVLEDRVRGRANAQPDLIGVELMSAAFRRGGLLIVSDLDAEQEAAHQLLRGFIGLFKNPTSHRLTTTYTSDSARAVVAFVDVLLGIVDTARQR